MNITKLATLGGAAGGGWMIFLSLTEGVEALWAGTVLACVSLACLTVASLPNPHD